jgi:type II secretory pathway pseudopilin PulG
MQNVTKYLKKNIKGSTLIELLITLGIMSILLTMLSNIFLQVMTINLKNKERTYVRDISSSVLNQIRKDIRNADTVDATYCGSVSNFGQLITYNRCIFNTNNKRYIWEVYVVDAYVLSSPQAYGIRKSECTVLSEVDCATKTTKYETPDDFLLQNDNVFKAEQNATGTTGSEAIVLSVTITGQSAPADGESPNAALVKNVIKQTIVSTRNYRQ